MISRGPAGSFDMDILLPASTIVTVGDEHWLYYSGANERHGTEAVRFDRQHAIGLAKLPRDRFIGLAADDEQGTIVTKPWKLTDPKVTLNIKAKNIHAMNLDNRKLNTINTDARAGACTVEVLDEQGQPIPEYSGDQSLAIEGVDALDFQPRWRQHADLSKLVGRTIQLRIRLRNAVVFAYHAQ
jgi:hypothetical protein